MSGAAAVTLMLTPSAIIQSRFTIPEGTSISHVPAIISKGTGIPVAKLQAAIADPAVARACPSYADGHVEGFLFPATYDVPPGTTATQVLRMMTARFAQAATATNLVAGAAALKLTPLQVVTIASIIQRESASTADGTQGRAGSSTTGSANGMPLGSEFTVAYTGQRLDQPVQHLHPHRRTARPVRLTRAEPVLDVGAAPGHGHVPVLRDAAQGGDGVRGHRGSQFFALQTQCRERRAAARTSDARRRAR